MNRHAASLTRELLNWKMIALSSLFAFVGGVAIVFGEVLTPVAGAWVSVLVRFGEMLFITGIVGIAWDVLFKRSFAEEIATRLEIAQSLRESGIVDVVREFPTDVEWEELFSRVKTLDVFTVFSRMWRKANTKRLETTFGTKGVLIRVILPDPDNEQLMGVLAARRGWTVPKVRDEIRQAEEFYRSLVTPTGASVEFIKMEIVQMHGLFKFDDVIVVKLYGHERRERLGPALVVKRGGSLFPFFEKQIDYVCSSFSNAGSDVK